MGCKPSQETSSVHPRRAMSLTITREFEFQQLPAISYRFQVSTKKKLKKETQEEIQDNSILNLSKTQRKSLFGQPRGDSKGAGFYSATPSSKYGVGQSSFLGSSRELKVARKEGISINHHNKLDPKVRTSMFASFRSNTDNMMIQGKSTPKLPVSRAINPQITFLNKTALSNKNSKGAESIGTLNSKNRKRELPTDKKSILEGNGLMSKDITKSFQKSPLVESQLDMSSILLSPKVSFVKKASNMNPPLESASTLKFKKTLKQVKSQEYDKCEFQNNLDALMEEVEKDSLKEISHNDTDTKKAQNSRLERSPESKLVKKKKAPAPGLCIRFNQKMLKSFKLRNFTTKTPGEDNKVPLEQPKTANPLFVKKNLSYSKNKCFAFNTPRIQKSIMIVNGGQDRSFSSSGLLDSASSSSEDLDGDKSNPQDQFHNTTLAMQLLNKKPPKNKRIDQIANQLFTEHLNSSSLNDLNVSYANHQEFEFSNKKKIKNYEIHGVIGKGAFAEVHRARNTETGTMVVSFQD